MSRKFLRVRSRLSWVASQHCLQWRKLHNSDGKFANQFPRKNWHLLHETVFLPTTYIWNSKAIYKSGQCIYDKIFIVKLKIFKPNFFFEISQKKYVTDSQFRSFSIWYSWVGVFTYGCVRTVFLSLGKRSENLFKYQSWCSQIFHYKENCFFFKKKFFFFMCAGDLQSENFSWRFSWWMNDYFKFNLATVC